MKPIRCAIVLLVMAASPARADWQLHGTPVAATSGSQASSCAVPDGAGGAIIAWVDSRGPSPEDIYAQRFDAAGRPLWTPNGRAVCAAANFQLYPVIVSDGAGGAIIAWADNRGGSHYDIYAQRISDYGDPLWTANGVAVCTAPNDQTRPTIVSDMAGGAIVSWQDARGATANDIYAQRLSAAGAPQWTANGVLLSNGALDQLLPVSVQSGVSGAIVAWTDMRNGANADIYFRPVSPTGIAYGTNGGVPLCTAAGGQDSPQIASGGPVDDFGAYVVWNDTRNGVDWNIYAQHVTSSAFVLWPGNGIPIADEPGNQWNPQIVPDDVGGAIVVWADLRGADSDIYAQRIDRTGARLWQEDGVPVCTAAGQQRWPAIAADGAGGAIIVWEDERPGTLGADLYAQRLDVVGNRLWFSSGVRVTGAPGAQATAEIVSDGAGSAIVTWNDFRAGTVGIDTYAQRVEGRYGEWGRPEPVADAADDLPADQGGQVTLRWQASQRDHFFQPLITHYSLWRALDAGATTAARAAASPARIDPASVGPGFAGSALWVETTAAGTFYWEWVANQSAAYLPAYSMIVPTRGDSVAGDAALHAFKVLAHGSEQMPARIWESNVASGYSTDDLAPAAPLALTAQRFGAGVYLRWNPAGVPDLRDYAIYRATAPGVAPEPGAFVAAASDTAAWDTAAPPTTLYYVVTAYDVHGNESPPSNEAEAEYGVTAVEELPVPAALAILPAQPNPFTHGTALRFGLPRPGEVAVRIVDVGGRRVRSFVLRGAAGWQSVRLDAVDDAGRPLASGVYLYTVAAGGRSARGKLVVAR